MHNYVRVVRPLYTRKGMLQKRFHTPKFQTKSAKAFQEFQLRMCIDATRLTNNWSTCQFINKLTDLRVIKEVSPS